MNPLDAPALYSDAMLKSNWTEQIRLRSEFPSMGAAFDDIDKLFRDIVSDSDGYEFIRPNGEKMNEREGALFAFFLAALGRRDEELMNMLGWHHATMREDFLNWDKVVVKKV